MSGDVRVLSVRQPWAWCLANGYKDIENRSWLTNFRGDIMIHASLSYDVAGEAWIRAHHPDVPLPPRDAMLTGGIVGMMRLHGICTDGSFSSLSSWFVGKYGWMVCNQTVLPFIPYKGGLGLRKFVPLQLGGVA